MIQVIVLDEPVVYKKELLTSLFLGMRRFSNKSRYFEYFCVFLYGNEFFVGVSAHDTHNALAQVGRKVIRLRRVQVESVA